MRVLPGDPVCLEGFIRLKTRDGRRKLTAAREPYWCEIRRGLARVLFEARSLSRTRIEQRAGRFLRLRQGSITRRIALSPALSVFLKLCRN